MLPAFFMGVNKVQKYLIGVLCMDSMGVLGHSYLKTN